MRETKQAEQWFSSTGLEQRPVAFTGLLGLHDEIDYLSDFVICRQHFPVARQRVEASHQ
jgi:hypothetical protein